MEESFEGLDEAKHFFAPGHFNTAMGSVSFRKKLSNRKGLSTSRKLS
ncbi:MAG: hypothetical protein IH593_12440 [Bacteroidales bacterium]|nr:hypothetical protein [Bacteroidales bacterium]